MGNSSGTSGLHSVKVIKSLVGIMICSGVVVLTSGCRNDHLDRLSLDAGNAIASNKAIHAIDPWPPEAFKDNQQTNGQRLARSYDRYESGIEPTERTPDRRAKRKE